ncbi:MAG: prephenate dehydratase [Desulfobulbus propionicus]|nr:MAG: prephenate dehydratase [Desulfobulbus propionicus]
MSSIATIGPEKGQAWLAASNYAGHRNVRLYPHVRELLSAFAAGEVDQAVVPVYNTREGENKQSFRLFDQLRYGFWIDNVVLQSDLALGLLSPTDTLDDLHTIVGCRSAFTQCEAYLEEHFADVALLSVPDTEQALSRLYRSSGYGIIDDVERLDALGLGVVRREVVAYNRTRYAVFASEQAAATGYDATVLFTEPLDDRVGMLVDILGEFTRRGINILDMRSENDIRTQKLRIYLEVEGHIESQMVRAAVEQVEGRVIRQPGAIRVLGSFPRLDMRTKHIRSFGFIGTGAMSTWFAERLAVEGYSVEVCGRSTRRRPEEMIAQVDVVVCCVPISATIETVRRYGRLMKDGQALILLAGESESPLDAAVEVTPPGVEVMLVHNLWGPQAVTMKDKNAIVVRTARSARFCSEFEAFLYKLGARIYHDPADRHDLLMGVGQKLPTVISVALALTLKENRIATDDILSHSTLTSLYPILAMARVHFQNPRTYAEIMATAGASTKIVHDFLRNLQQVADMADAGRIDSLCTLIEANRTHLGDTFLEERMEQARAVDDVLG